MTVSDELLRGRRCMVVPELEGGTVGDVVWFESGTVLRRTSPPSKRVAFAYLRLIAIQNEPLLARRLSLSPP